MVGTQLFVQVISLLSQFISNKVGHRSSQCLLNGYYVCFSAHKSHTPLSQPACHITKECMLMYLPPRKIFFIPIDGDLFLKCNKERVMNTITCINKHPHVLISIKTILSAQSNMRYFSAAFNPRRWFYRNDQAFSHLFSVELIILHQ